MDLKAKISTLELKTVALAKALSEHDAELEKVKKQVTNPVPLVRKNLKANRMQQIENFYTKRKLNKSSC